MKEVLWMGLSKHKSIVLIGFMGVGKTTIGNILAKRLVYDFIDVDKKIEKKLQMSIPQIFSQYGEAVFRNSERDLFFQNVHEHNKVVSLGGGAFLQEEIKKVCLEECTVIYLEMSWKYWKERLNFLKGTRPLLQDKNLTEINQLFNERLSIYQDYHYKVNIDGLRIEDAVAKILDTIRKDKG